MIHTGSESKEKLCKNLTKSSKNQMKLRVVYIWSNRGRTVSISQKLVVMPKNIQSQDSQTTFKPNLTCIFLSVRANLEYPLCHGGPCTILLQTSLPNPRKSIFNFVPCSKKYFEKKFQRTRSNLMIQITDQFFQNHNIKFRPRIF